MATQCGSCESQACELLDETLRSAMMEQMARPMYQEAIAYCESVRDYVSRGVVGKVLDSEEEHIDWLETQIGLIDGRARELSPVAEG